LWRLIVPETICMSQKSVSGCPRYLLCGREMVQPATMHQPSHPADSVRGPCPQTPNATTAAHQKTPPAKKMQTTESEASQQHSRGAIKPSRTQIATDGQLLSDAQQTSIRGDMAWQCYPLAIPLGQTAPQLRAVPAPEGTPGTAALRWVIANSGGPGGQPNSARIRWISNEVQKAKPTVQHAAMPSAWQPKSRRLAPCR